MLRARLVGALLRATWHCHRQSPNLEIFAWVLLDILINICLPACIYFAYDIYDTNVVYDKSGLKKSIYSNLFRLLYAYFILHHFAGVGVTALIYKFIDL